MHLEAVHNQAPGKVEPIQPVVLVEKGLVEVAVALAVVEAVIVGVVPVEVISYNHFIRMVLTDKVED